MVIWLKRHATHATSVFTALVLVAIALASSDEANTAEAWLSARQLSGLTAYAFLMGSALIGPAAGVLTRLPAKSVWIAARRAVGVSAFVLALMHAGCYLVPTVALSWRGMFTPGWRWVIGLALGSIAFADLLVLTWTSRDAAVKRLGGQRWKRLHRTIYIAVLVVFAHAVLIGSDFGFRSNADAPEPDVGSLVGFALVITLWLALLELRRRRIRWPSGQ